MTATGESEGDARCACVRSSRRNLRPPAMATVSDGPCQSPTSVTSTSGPWPCCLPAVAFWGDISTCPSAASLPAPSCLNLSPYRPH